jgi:hypothetical protein
MREMAGMKSDDPDFIDKLIAQVDAEEAELKMLRRFHNEVGAALANENAGDIKHLLAASALGKHTTIIGRKRYEQLLKAEEKLRQPESHHNKRPWAWAVVDPNERLRNTDGDKVDRLICWDWEQAVYHQEFAADECEEGDEQPYIIELFPASRHSPDRAENG